MKTFLEVHRRLTRMTKNTLRQGEVGVHGQLVQALEVQRLYREEQECPVLCPSRVLYRARDCYQCVVVLGTLGCRLDEAAHER